MNWRTVLVIGFVGIGTWLVAGIFAGGADGDLDDPHRGKTVVAVKSTAGEVEALRVALGDKAVEALKPKAIDEGVELPLTYDSAAQLYVDMRLADPRQLTRQQLESLGRLMFAINDELQKHQLRIEEHPRYRRMYTQMMNRITDADKRDFVVIGTIVDQDGNPLDEVDVQLFSSVSVAFGKSHDVKVAEGKVNKEFRYEVSGVHSVSLSFRKSGYYSELDVFVSPEADGERQLLAVHGLPLGPAGVYTKALPIVLEKVREFGHLVNSGERIEHFADGRRNAVVFDERWNLKKVEVAAGDDINSLHHGFSITGVPNDQRFESTKVRGQSRDYERTVPKDGVELVIHDDHGGIVLHRPKLVRADALRWVLDRMPEAPENGYQRRLIVTADELASGVYFFFKTAGRYGKGCLTQMEVTADGGSVRCLIVVDIQPREGIRNVNTRR
jgi:hypothetical protein